MPPFFPAAIQGSGLVTLVTVGRNVNLCSHYRKHMEVPQNLKHKLHYPTFTLLGIYLGETKNTTMKKYLHYHKPLHYRQDIKNNLNICQFLNE